VFCDSLVVNEQGDTFSIEGPYRLNCNELRVFNYINQARLWTDGICNWKEEYLNLPSDKQHINKSKTVTYYFSYYG
jgi:hypothetical protein